MKSAKELLDERLTINNGFHKGAMVTISRKTIEELMEEYHVQFEELYAFCYNPMIHESCFGIISIHRTRKGAEMAMEFHKAEALKEYNKFNANRNKEDTFEYPPFGTFEAWKVFKYELIN